MVAMGYYDESHQGVPRHVGRRDVLTHCYKAENWSRDGWVCMQRDQEGACLREEKVCMQDSW